MAEPAREEIKQAMDDVEALNLPDFAYWQEVHNRLGLKYGDLFDLLEKAPEYFNLAVSKEKANG